MDLKSWTEILLRQEDTLEYAIKVIDSGGNRVALVVDNRKLVGILTDGDVRRALIGQVGMSSPVKEVMTHNPVTSLESDSRRSIMQKMKASDLLHIPIVSRDNILVGLESLGHIIDNNKLDNPVFLMAGGFGTRLRPLTKNKPKPLLNIGNKPILETIIDQFIDYGFHNFYISVHYKAEMIQKYFGDGSSKGVSIEYIHEESPLGTAGSLGLLPENISELPLIMMNGDLLTRLDFSHLLYYHLEQGGGATMCVREYDFEVPYGVVQIDGGRVKDIVEKPVHNFFVNAGIYVLDHTLVKKVKGGDFLDMPTLLEERINNQEHVNTFLIHEYWLDIGQMDEYERANREIDFFDK